MALTSCHGVWLLNVNFYFVSMVFFFINTRLFQNVDSWKRTRTRKERERERLLIIFNNKKHEIQTMRLQYLQINRVV